MKYCKEINGKRVFFNGVLEVGDKQIINPTHEQIVANGWEEYIPPVPSWLFNDRERLR